jgi:hypothetical protein
MICVGKLDPLTVTVCPLVVAGRAGAGEMLTGSALFNTEAKTNMNIEARIPFLNIENSAYVRVLFNGVSERRKGLRFVRTRIGFESLWTKVPNHQRMYFSNNCMTIGVESLAFGGPAFRGLLHSLGGGARPNLLSERE